MNTYVKWSDGYPTKEVAEKKLIMCEWKNFAIPQFIDLRHGEKYDNYDWYRCMRFTILSDEPACEWRPDGNPLQPGYMNPHNARCLFLPDKPEFCMFCGLPIHIVDELKPLPLMGIEPEIIFDNGLNDTPLPKGVIAQGSTPMFYIEYCTKNDSDWFIQTPEYKTEREAIESWNELVGKVTGNHE